MKTKIFKLLVLLFFTAISLNAQTSITENFNYPAGDSLGAHGWVSFSGGNTNVLSIVAPGLSFTGYKLSNIGNACKISNNGQDAYKSLVSPDSLGVLYFSIMVRIDSAKTGDYFFALLPSNSTTNFTCRVYAKDTLGAVYFGLSKNSASGGPITYTTASYSYGTTYLLVAKYKFNSGSTADDEVSLFVVSGIIPNTEPSVPSVGPLTGAATDVGNIGRVSVRQGTATSSPTLIIDGILGGKSWSAIITGLQNISTVTNKFFLSQNYPNPFNPETNINFSIPSNGFVNMRVFNSLGQEVNSLVSDNLTAGTYNTRFNGSNLSSGVYCCKIEFTSHEGKFFTDIKKLVLIK